MIVPLSQVAEINPKADLPAHLAPNAMLDFLPMADVSEAGVVSVTAQRPLSEVQKGFTAFRKGDILIAKITPCFENNKIAVADIATEFGFGSTEFHVVRCQKSRLDSRYVLHLLRSNDVRAEGKKRMTGSAGQQRVPKKFLEELQIPLPPLEEQKRIAAILDQADELRRKRQCALDRLGQLGQAIFIEMFGDEEHAPIPLSDYFEEIRMGPFGSLLHKSDYVEGGIPLINPMHISGGEIVPDPTFSISQSKAAELENYRLRAGDLVVGRRGEMGRCAVVSDKHEGYLCGTGSMFLRAARDKTDPFFLSELIRSRKVVERIEAVASGVTMMNLNSKSFDRVMVPDVSISEQREYFRRVEHVSAVKPEMDRALSRLISLFASLQHRAFRGEL